MDSSFDLLSTIEDGGCSAKLPAELLSEVLADLPLQADPNLLVNIETHDDAGVYRLSKEQALIFTTDFFPPICSDPYEFGQIAAANALSDVYAMGGKVLLALNLMMFPSAKIPLEVFAKILEGGQERVSASGGLIVGGHTIDDSPPKYGLAVIGTVHPDKLITNAGAGLNDVLVLTKALGTGALVSGHKSDIAREADYRSAIDQMKELNRIAAEEAVRFGVSGMTDITGFGLAGHALKMAEASRVSLSIHSSMLPVLPGAYESYEKGSIPGACFRNQDFVGEKAHFTRQIDYNLKMLTHDPQTSGGMLMSVPIDLVSGLLASLREKKVEASIIGEVLPESPRRLYFD
ncbi:MAG: selenide, water dikinase SelD [Bacteroidetes bacterium]|nr:MAG: selenide, water dikinase SelD [Bacteroidota bacterium]